MSNDRNSATILTGPEPCIELHGTGSPLHGAAAGLAFKQVSL
jgi:hypothetical protein